jgi:hypothetical protein
MRKLKITVGMATLLAGLVLLGFASFEPDNLYISGLAGFLAFLCVGLTNLLVGIYILLRQWNPLSHSVRWPKLSVHERRTPQTLLER